MVKCYKVLFSIEKKRRAKACNLPETWLRENEFMSENSNFELKSNLQMPSIGHCSPNYRHDFMEHFRIFPTTDDPTKEKRVGMPVRPSKADNHVTVPVYSQLEVICHIAKLQRIYRISKNFKGIALYK